MHRTYLRIDSSHPKVNTQRYDFLLNLSTLHSWNNWQIGPAVAWAHEAVLSKAWCQYLQSYLKTQNLRDISTHGHTIVPHAVSSEKQNPLTQKKDKGPKRWTNPRKSMREATRKRQRCRNGHTHQCSEKNEQRQHETKRQGKADTSRLHWEPSQWKCSGKKHAHRLKTLTSEWVAKCHGSSIDLCTAFHLHKLKTLPDVFDCFHVRRPIFAWNYTSERPTEMWILNIWPMSLNLIASSRMRHFGIVWIHGDLCLLKKKKRNIISATIWASCVQLLKICSQGLRLRLS